MEMSEYYVTLNPKENTFQESAGIHSEEKYMTGTLGWFGHTGKDFMTVFAQKNPWSDGTEQR